MRLTARTVWPLAALTATAFAAVTLLPHGAAAPAKLAASTIPTPAHVVIVMEENHSYADIINSSSTTTYFNSLASQGALLTDSFAVTHPSEPNYMALFAGSTFGLTADTCPANEGSTANLGSELLAAGDTFKGYSEGLPKTGSTTCTSGNYARKHSPWINFSNVPTADSLPFTSFPSSSNYASLPTLSFVIPNLNDDMHNGTIAQANTWLQTNLSAYATWAKTHNSLLIVTFDEDSGTSVNQIFTTFTGAHVKVGSYSESISHYTVLRTIEAAHGLPGINNAASKSPILDVWK